jgi:DNA-binding response OmpR family regulator
MNKKIMIVDDDPDILVSLRHIFEHEGFEVITVDTGSDCLNELEHGFKGVVLIDLMMPFMNGWDTIREIVNRRLNQNIVISIITAKGTLEHEKMKGVEPYIHDYITKPFNLPELVNNVTHMLHI